MGKTPKKAAPGGDERNLYDRRPKAPNAPSKASETSLHERQRESESSNRRTLSGIQKKVPPGQGKNIKSKLRTPKKLGPHQPSKQINKSSGTSKEEHTVDFPQKSVELKATVMQPESEETEVKLNVSTVKESTMENVSVRTTKEMVKEIVEQASSDQVTTSSEQDNTNASTNKEPAFTEEQIEPHVSENNSQVNSCIETKDVEEHDESDIKLSFDTEEIALKVQDDRSNEKDLIHESNGGESQLEKQNGICEKEDLQTESVTSTEKCAADVEFAVSELPNASKENWSRPNAAEETEKPTEGTNTDETFVSYDPTIMLKDVQIKLNDCLKDNSKLYDVSTTELGTPTQSAHDVSFGKSLRNISGRNSINRMRHVTLREQRYSPNSSLFVNTSSMSLPQEETADFKILRGSTGLSDAGINGSSIERKRKLRTERWSPAKKPKTGAENSLLNTSISLLKGLRRPVQVSTPITEYKFSSSKLNISGINDEESKMINEPLEGTKKWCTIM